MQISLKNLKFYALHGVLPQENVVGGHYVVDVTLHVDDADAAQALWNDRLEHTVNYAEAYAVIQEQMQQPSALIEHVAARIARALLQQFVLLRSVDVAVTKCNPPIAGFDGQGATVRFAMRRRMVIWDFDGTIADTRQGIVRTMHATLGQLGLKQPTDEAICQTIGLPLPQCIAQLTDLQGEPLKQATALYRELFLIHGMQGTVLFPGVAEAMKRQCAGGQIVAIATSRGHDSTVQLCQQLGLSQYISHLVACEDVALHKPHPQPVLTLCRMAHVLPADTTVIGDTQFDIEMGVRAGSELVMGVSWGNHTAEQLIKAGAHRVVHSAEEL